MSPIRVPGNAGETNHGETRGPSAVVRMLLSENETPRLMPKALRASTISSTATATAFAWDGAQ